MDLGLIAGLFALALFVGIYGTIIGAGGGFIMVAGLVLLFDLTGATAVGTSIVTTWVIQLTGAINYDRQGLVDRSVVKWFAVGSIPIAFASAAFLADRIPQRTFDVLIGVLLLLLAALVVLTRARSEGGQPVEPRRLRLAAGGGAIGVLGGAFGVGAGLVTVPLLSWLQGMSAHRAAATTTGIGALSGLAASLGHTIAGNPKWSYIPFAIAGAVAGGRIGSQSAHLLTPGTVRLLLALGLVAAGVPLLARGI